MYDCDIYFTQSLPTILGELDAKQLELVYQSTFLRSINPSKSLERHLQLAIVGDLCMSATKPKKN